MKVALVLNTSWNIYHFRRGLVKALLQQGHEVIAIAPQDPYSEKLTQLGCTYINMQMDSRGISPRKDILLWRELTRILAQTQPDVVLGFTIKPNIYGSLAAARLGIPVINNVSGLGTAFLERPWLAVVAKMLYRRAFRKSYRVFFQNRDDMALFLKNRLVKKTQTGLLPGSGIDLEYFSPAPLPPRKGKDHIFLMISRLLIDKGVKEYVEAARRLKTEYPNLHFQLMGSLDERHRRAIRPEELEAWEQEEVIEYLGVKQDVRPFISSAHCIVLPSYREGTPRTLLEAAAMGRPIITTDVPGCREVVREGYNGYLAEVKNVKDLARVMEDLIHLNDDQISALARNSRELAVAQFDENLVIQQYLQAIEGVNE